MGLSSRAVLAICLCLSLGFSAACATPTTQKTSAVPSPLHPWTPTRLGEHPGEFAHPRVPSAHSGHSAATPVVRSPLATTAFLAWRLYSATLSRQMGDTCRFTPTCSHFAVHALATGPEGILFTFGRLQRNHLDQTFYGVDDAGFLPDRPRDYLFWRTDAGLQAHGTDLPRAQAWYVFHRATHESRFTPPADLPAPQPPTERRGDP